MWSAVPGVEDLSSGSDSDGGKSVKSEDDNSHGSQSPKTSKASFDNNVTAPPRGTSEQHWKTFCQLKRRRDELSKFQPHDRPTNKGKRKHLTDEKEDASASFSSLNPQGTESDKLTSEECSSSKSTADQDPESPGPSKRSPPTSAHEGQEQWDVLKKHLHVNEHIHQGIDHGQYNPHKSGLEKQIDEAVEVGRFDQAEELSDQLATRDFACKIAKSADARDYLKWKKAEEDKRKAKKKKRKLNWGFEVKERWQMKGNM